MDSLGHYISEETIKYHYGEHHKSYADNLNLLIVNNEFDKCVHFKGILNYKSSLFNNASQVWNHNLLLELYRL